jgi:hypothetical protein
MFRPRVLACLSVLFLAAAPVSIHAQVTASPAEAEAQKCEDKIASVRRDVLGKYDDALSELQLTLQKAADLDGALAVRAERQRVKTEQSLSEKEYATEPKALRALQLQSVTKMRELIAALVQDTLPKLIEFKKSLTVAGKLDEAVAVRAAIERLQNDHVPVVRADAGAVVPADTLLLAYAGDRARADKTYKGQKITVHGILGGYRLDPADPKYFYLFLTGTSGSGWIQCTYSSTDYRFREEKSAFGAISYVITTKDGDASVRLQKGQTIDIRGTCGGFDEMVRLDRCELPK